MGTGAAALAVVAACWGCSGTPAVVSSETEAMVKGTVKAYGKPITAGEVVFDPSNYKRTEAPERTAKIQKDGTYQVTTLVGENSVRVSGPAVEKDPDLGYANLKFDVQSGENTYNIELPPK